MLKWQSRGFRSLPPPSSFEVTMVPNACNIKNCRQFATLMKDVHGILDQTTCLEQPTSKLEPPDGPDWRLMATPRGSTCVPNMRGHVSTSVSVRPIRSASASASASECAFYLIDRGHYGDDMARLTNRLWTDEEKRLVFFQTGHLSCLLLRWR